MQLVDLDDADLDPVCAERFTSFQRLLQQKELEREVLLVYRGESVDSLTAALVRLPRAQPMSEVHRRVFYFGVKARRFLENATGDHDARDFVSSINDTSEAALAYLFDRVGNVFDHPRQGPHSARVCSQTFRRFFEDGRNCERFVNSIVALPDDDRLAIRDYYLFFLHTCGRAGIHEGTPLVSTSVERRVARGFALPRWRHTDEPRIIHYFIPRPVERLAIVPWESPTADRAIESLGLPCMPPRGLFPKQWEVSVKGALLPHFVIALQIPGQRKLIPNPYLFQEPDLPLEDVVQSGLPIDQGLFPDTIFETAFVGFAATNLNGEFREYRVR
jgi:hypothetical protein